MQFHLGVTDNSWYDHPAAMRPSLEDISFWQLGATMVFKDIPRGAPFFFKLKSPRHHIGGVGFFSSNTFLSLSMA